MSNKIVQLLQRLLGLAGPSASVAHRTLPAKELLGDALDRGARVRMVEPSELSAEFEGGLLDVCSGDTNVEGLWLAWMTSGGDTPELLAILVLARPDELSIRDFIKRADALGGPSFVAAIPKGIPSAKPFYRREV